MRASPFAAAAALAALAVTTVSAAYVTDVCNSKCRFKFCDGEQEFKVGGYADKPFTGAICDKRGKIHVGIVGQTGEAYVVEYTRVGHGTSEKISEWHPHGLLQNFSPHFFKSFAISHEKHSSGIGHETPQQNQEKFLDGKCFTLGLRAYQVIEKSNYGHDWNVVKNVQTVYGDPKVDCVAFKTTVSLGNGDTYDEGEYNGEGAHHGKDGHYSTSDDYGKSDHYGMGDDSGIGADYDKGAGYGKVTDYDEGDH